MPKNWTEAKLKNFITSGIEESLTLEYKSAEALDRSEYKKKEITKDVSAMANSAGGILIYGIAEFSAENKRHLPEKITPVNRNEFPREWVEQIINAIRPRIDGIVIHSVNLSSGETHMAYIIEIPQSNTAHQASDHRYYKRFNFQVRADGRLRSARRDFPRTNAGYYVEFFDRNYRRKRLEFNYQSAKQRFGVRAVCRLPVGHADNFVKRNQKQNESDRRRKILSSEAF